jgi:uncharacterized membrane protein
LTGTPPSGAPSTTGLEPNVASALAYVAGPFSGALVLAAERSSGDVRFHAWQSILALGALWALGVVLYILAFASILVSSRTIFVLLSLAAIVWFGSIVLCAACVFRAYTGRRWKLPVVGDYAERKAAPPDRPAI